MTKVRINITLDPDVLAYIDWVAADKRLERSAYINALFAGFMSEMPKGWNLPAKRKKAISIDMAPDEKPAARRKRS
jgi:hypothetical protein